MARKTAKVEKKFKCAKCHAYFVADEGDFCSNCSGGADNGSETDQDNE